MTQEEFEHVAEEVYASLPEVFRSTIDNVHIVVEDTPAPGRKLPHGVRSGSLLLGLYEGIPLTKRDTSYGMYPVIPDRITLFKSNIERVSSSEEDLRARIREVLIHEIAHYFGMSDREIRRAGY